MAASALTVTWTRFRFELFRLYLTKTWPWRKRWGRALCWLNKHDWEEAPAFDKAGEPDPSHPARWLKCRRATCEVLRGKPTLLMLGKRVETHDFMVLARTDCRHCHGRGYGGRMVLRSGVKAKIPCRCLTVQPAYVERPRGATDDVV